MNLDINIIIDDNPISRCYIYILKKKNIKFKNLIYLQKKNFLLTKKLNAILNYRNKNHYPLIFLKDRNLKKLVREVELYFGFEENFFLNMYNFENMFHVSENIFYCNSENINSDIVIKKLNDLSKSYIFNTGSQILKEILDCNHKFVHIHPGYLPNIKGADGSLWHVLKTDYFGVSSFFMNKKIDNGIIISRKKINLPTFDKNILISKDVKKLYRFWFSFIDPLIRGSLFLDLVENKFDFENIIDKKVRNESSHYYSFMEDKNLKKVFNKIFR